MFSIPDCPAVPLENVLNHHKQFQSTFDKPLPLAILKAVSVVTCMDGRLMPASMFGFKLGEAECAPFPLGSAKLHWYIRNAGGRVTDDVIRSLFVAQELLHTKVILLVHHTGGSACVVPPLLADFTHPNTNLLLNVGAQAAVRHHDELMAHAKNNLGLDLSGYKMLGIGDSMEGLYDSVKEDIAKLRASPLINPNIEIYGFVYDVKDASLTEVMRSVRREE